MIGRYIMSRNVSKKYRKGDDVTVTTGRDKGKTGSIVKVIPEENRVIVQGVNLVKRHVRPSQSNPGGIVEKESSIHISNLAHIDPDTGKPTRVGLKFLEDKRKVRFSKRSGEILD